jgi:hypothetical protein
MVEKYIYSSAFQRFGCSQKQSPLAVPALMPRLGEVGGKEIPHITLDVCNH